MLEWQSRYEVGNETIDAEHRKLFELANIILQVNQAEEEAETLKQVVRDLFAYMKYHFEHEESLMTESGYTDLKRHQEIHRGIIDEMNRILKSMTSFEQLKDNLKEMMMKWILQHIIDEDSKIAAAL